MYKCTYSPVSSEVVCIAEVLCCPDGVIQIREEIQVVLVEVGNEEIPGHLGPLNHILETGQDRISRM